MTEPLDLPDADPADLAASAALDAGFAGAGTPFAAAGTRSDSPEPLEPPVAERLEQFRQVRSAMVSDITPPDPVTRDAHIATALAALSVTAGATTTPVADDRPVAAAPDELAARRPGAARHRTRNRWLAVAAAVALVALAVPLVNALRQQSSSSTNMAASTATEPPGDAVTPSGAPVDPRTGAGDVTTTSGSAAALQSEAAASATTVAPAVAGDLGSASSPQELASLVQTAEPEAMTATPPPPAATDAGAPTTTTDPAGPAGCDGAVRGASPELGALVVVTTAAYRGVPVEVLVYATTSSTVGAHRLIAVTASDCATVVDLTF